MQCAEARQAIESQPGGTPLADQVRMHVQGCELCQRFAEDMLLTRRLQDMDAPEPSAQFVDRAIGHAVKAPRRSWPGRSLLAIAASFLVAGLLVSLVVTQQQTAPAPPLNAHGEAEVEEQYSSVNAVEAETGQRQVRIMIHSNQDEEAELSIALAENLELEGFAGQQTVVWRAQLRKGDNLLTLPLKVRGEGGQLRVLSRFSAREHEVAIDIEQATVPNDLDSRTWHPIDNGTALKRSNHEAGVLI